MSKVAILTLIKIILIILCCSIILISVVSFSSMSYTSSSFSKIENVSRNYHKLQTASRYLVRVRRNLDYLTQVSGIGHTEFDNRVSALHKDMSLTKSEIDNYIKAQEVDDEGIKLSKEIESKFTGLFNIYNKDIARLSTYSTDKISNSTIDEMELDDALKKYEAYSQKIEQDITSEFSKHKNIFWIISISFLCIAVAISYISYMIIKKSVFDRLQYASSALDEIRLGELYHDINIGTQNEIGTMLETMETMRKTMLEVVTLIKTSSEEISANTAEIDNANNDLAFHTDEQASSLQQTAASMEEIKVTVSNTARHAQQANELAHTARTIAGNGSEVMSDVITTMDKISQSAKKIHEINSVIDGIANQTNILALNAAVEAARAGEQGRGFSVVATEVRNLAKRSADAAKEISGLISQAVENVDDGAKLVENAGGTMNEIVNSVTRVSEIMQQITQASEEQSCGINQISTAVNEIDFATQQNASMVKKSLEISLNMSKHAEGLQNVMSMFSLESKVEASDIYNDVPVSNKNL